MRDSCRGCGRAWDLAFLNPKPQTLNPKPCFRAGGLLDPRVPGFRAGMFPLSIRIL